MRFQAATLAVNTFITPTNRLRGHHTCRSCMLAWLLDPRFPHDRAHCTHPSLLLHLQAVNFFTFEVYRQALSGIYGPDAWMLRYVAGACAGGHSMLGQCHVLRLFEMPAPATSAMRTLQLACKCSPLQPTSSTPHLHCCWRGSCRTPTAHIWHILPRKHIT
jgi:hypothetical protein